MNNLSLFTGSGIGDLAARDAGIETVAMCESDPCCGYCLEQLWPGVPLFRDVHDVSAESLRQRGIGQVDIISGGFPCQDLSTAGRGAGIEGSRSGLWREMFRVIRQVRPIWLVIENVPAIRLRGADRVLAPLERIGYTCWPLVVGAEATGGTMGGERVWIVATRQSKRLSTDLLEAVPKQTVWEMASDERRDGQSERCGRMLGHSTHPPRPGDPRWSRILQGDEQVAVAELPVCYGPDGMAKRIPGRANKALLRMVGNAWCYPNARLIYEWIARREEEDAHD